MKTVVLMILLLCVAQIYCKSISKHRHWKRQSIKKHRNAPPLTNEHCNGKDARKNSSNANNAKATNIALKAAQDAKAASEAQQSAAQQVAQQVKTQLAEKAQEAAKSAEVALAGKQSLVNKLEEQVREATGVIQEENKSLQDAQSEYQKTQHVNEMAIQQQQNLQAMLQLQNREVKDAELAAQGAQQQLTEKAELQEVANEHVQTLVNDLHSAKTDLDNTQQAASKAQAAAQAAKENAAKNRKRKRRRSKRNHRRSSATRNLDRLKN